jgi:hypothetical protein
MYNQPEPMPEFDSPEEARMLVFRLLYLDTAHFREGELAFSWAEVHSQISKEDYIRLTHILPFTVKKVVNRICSQEPCVNFQRKQSLMLAAEIETFRLS